MPTETKTSHTPTPWEAVNGYHIFQANGGNDLIAVVRSDDRPYPEVQANAAFIVRAVNSHDALVDALEEARRYIDKLHEFLPEGGTGLGDKIDRKIQSALKLATE